MTYVEKEAGSFGDKLLPLDAFDPITHALIVHHLTQPDSQYALGAFIDTIRDHA